MNSDLKESVGWSETQYRRLKELGARGTTLDILFDNERQRDRAFQEREKTMVREAQERLDAFLAVGGKPQLVTLTENLANMLVSEGYRQVTTPTVITKYALAKMTIDEQHPLFHQVFWLDGKQCLRPMLAPNLYSLMQDFGRRTVRPIRFFEIGSCFRKESNGANHTSEFTMLNIVEMGLPLEERQERLMHLASQVATTAGLTDFEFMEEESEVYGKTLDMLAGSDRIEVGSGAMGPHPLDGAWGVRDTWVGMGFGLERMVMISQQDDTIGKWCRNLGFYDGIRLRV